MITRSKNIVERIKEKVSVEHSFNRTEWSVLILAVFVVSYYGAWVIGDLLPRLFAFIFIIFLSGYYLSRGSSTRNILKRSFYLLGVFTLLIPVALWSIYLTSPAGLQRPFALIFTPGDFVVLVLFVLLAGVLRTVGRRVGGK